MDWSKVNTTNIKAAANVAIAIAALFLSGAISFPPGTSEATQHTILAWDSWILAVVAALNGILHFVPDFTVPTARIAPPIVKTLIVGFLLTGALTLGAPQARAASVPVTTSPTLPNPFATLFNSVKTFTVADLQAALDDANAQSPPDTRHAACWQALIPIAQANLTNPLPAGVGAAQAIQKVFDDSKIFGSQPWKDAVAQACALTELDLQTTLNVLLLKVGVSAVTLPKL